MSATTRVTVLSFGLSQRPLALPTIHKARKSTFPDKLVSHFVQLSWRKYVRNFFRTRLRSCHPLAKETSDRTVSLDCFMRSDMQNSRSRRVRVARNS